MPAGRASLALRDLSGELAELPYRAMITAAKATKRAAVDEARRVTGDGRLSGVGRRGVRMRAVDQIRTLSSGVVVCHVQGLPVGGWVWMNTGARPHRVAPKRRRRGPRVMAGDLRHPVSIALEDTGGTAGRGAWRNVVRDATEVLPAAVEAELRRVVVRRGA